MRKGNQLGFTSQPFVKEVCEACGHSFKDNNHGFDQNDFWLDGDILFYKGSCTYCNICNPI